MLVAYYAFIGAFLRIVKFSNFTLPKLKNLFKNFKSNTSLKPPLLFGTKKLRDTYCSSYKGTFISLMATDDK